MSGYRLIIINFLLSVVTVTLRAQTEKIINGTIVLNDSSTPNNIKVNEVSIDNITNNSSTKPDNLGNFKLDARIGDSLEVYLKGFPKKHILIKNYEHLTIYLDSTILLDEVNINGSVDKKTNLRETAMEYSRQHSIYFGGKPPITLLSPFDGSPITFFRELLGKDGKRVRRFNQLIDQQLEFDAIDARFNTETIKQAVPINDYEMEAFKTAYRPAVDSLKRWSEYELYDYIKRSYQEFKKVK